MDGYRQELDWVDYIIREYAYQPDLSAFGHTESRKNPLV